MKLAILDRDGTLNPLGDDFITSPEEWSAQPGALEAVARLNHAGWRVVVATNQPGLGRGLFDVVSLNAIHAKMLRQVAAVGGASTPFSIARTRPTRPAIAARLRPACWNRSATAMAWSLSMRGWWAVAPSICRRARRWARRCTWCARAARPICNPGSPCPSSFPPPRGRMPAWQHLSSICCPRRLQRLCRSQRLRSRLPLGQTHRTAPQRMHRRSFLDAIYLIAACA